MDINGCIGSEQAFLVNELTKGLELAKRLKAHLGVEISTETRQMLLEEILSSIDKSLFILHWCGMTEQPQQAIPLSAMPSSPISFSESPRSDDLNVGHQDGSRVFSKKRKATTMWTKQAKVTSENVVGSLDDGYSWRKYGQKDILRAKYPRSYYRCAYRNVQDCWATKLVQRSDEDPSIFNITYKGEHTCRPATRSKSAPASPKIQEPKLHQLQITEYQQEPNVISNFQTCLSMDIPNMDNKELAIPFSSTAIGYMNADSHNLSSSTLNNINFSGSSSQSSIPPATSESNYFSKARMDYFGDFKYRQQSESDINEIIPATISGTDPPIVDLDFSLDPLHFNPSFPFDNPRFFP